MVRLGTVPYQLFVERDTAPRDYFAVPLARGYEICREAYSRKQWARPHRARTDYVRHPREGLP
jgi:hypothetical protein